MSNFELFDLFYDLIFIVHWHIPSEIALHRRHPRPGANSLKLAFQRKITLRWPVPHVDQPSTAGNVFSSSACLDHRLLGPAQKNRVAK